MYETPCVDSNRSYVGSTNRRVTEGRNEDVRSVKKADNTSALAQHNSETGHTIKFEDMKTLTTVVRAILWEVMETGNIRSCKTSKHTHGT